MSVFEMQAKYKDHKDGMGTVTILCARCSTEGIEGTIRRADIRELMKSGWLCIDCESIDKPKPRRKPAKKKANKADAGHTEQG